LSFAEWTAGIVERWRLVLTVSLATVALALLATVVIDPIYRSTSTFVANAGGGLNLPAGLGSLGGLASQFGVSAGTDPSESPQFYTQLINSRELLTRLVLSRYRDPRSANPADSANLITLFDVRKKDPAQALEVAVKEAANRLDVSADVKTNLVTVTGDAQWAGLSAAMVNRTVGLVNAFNLEQRISRARDRRAFVEARAAEAQRDLDAAEARLQDFNEQNRQWRNSPTLASEQAQIDRQVALASDVYLTLRRELETARIDELNEAALITVVDSAVPPRRRVWPRYGLALVSAAVIGVSFGVLAAGIAVLLAYWASQNADEALTLRLAAGRAVRELGGAFRAGRARAATNGPDPGP
jgi:uncharacterized protein involved in exopolysaccharide biosynthesis